MSDDVLAEESGQVADEAARPDDSAPTEGSAGPTSTEPETELQVALRERDELRDIAMRLQADFENYRKRVTQQAADDIDRATGRLAEALLPVLDACEAAFAHGADGVEPVWSALIGALQKQGLEALDLLGRPFDPAVAEAVVHEPGEGGEPVVAEVLRTGYAWKGRVLRAAMVKVRG
jgi:molecular chaperone GrpE